MLSQNPLLNHFLFCSSFFFLLLWKEHTESNKGTRGIVKDRCGEIAISQDGVSQALSPQALTPSHPTFYQQWPCTVMQQLGSLTALCIRVNRCSAGPGLLCVVYLCKLHLEKPRLFEVMLYYVNVCCYNCCVSQERGCVMTVMPARRESNCVSTYGSFKSSSSLLAWTLPTLGSAKSMNSKTIGVTNRISNTIWLLAIIFISGKMIKHGMTGCTFPE